MDGDSVKVLLTGPDGEVETLWAIARGNDRYELDNLPWFAYGVSAGDVVEASPDELGMPVFRRIVHKSGNRTVRVMLERAEGTDQMTAESQRTLDQLRAAGCDYEGMHRKLFAINVPPAVALNTVADILIASGFQWEYADPTYDELHPGSAGQGGNRDA
ncbi:MAG TPA: DUF4265 domain-containing protein [Gemmatimonadaceae bacterium]|nr:DUF4265 domain-containing protein [Gemmatimonadaceae bacterium]